MLTITIPARELYDEKQDLFITIKGQTLQLEHSLVSLSKWESKWHKPYISDKEKTYEETLDYIKCMTITQNVDPNVYKFLTEENIYQIKAYIDDPMTATTCSDPKTNKRDNRPITSELIYYWMIALQIPVEFQKWHLNRLLMLIKVCNAENTPPKKGNRRETINRYAALNEARRKKLNSKG